MDGSTAILFITLSALFLLPGLAFVNLFRFVKSTNFLQQACLVLGISVSFYPVLFYWTKTLLPSFHLGPRKLAFLLALLAAAALVSIIRSRKWNLRICPSDWMAVGIFAFTLFLRLWMAVLYPYPAWSDSLHHTLLTQLTAQQGQLPSTLEPFGPIPLDMYHLGLYAISGSAQMLSQVPAHTALLWTSQFLNAFSVVGVFLVLDSLVSRRAAIVGMAFVGLFSIQPAFYVNWGRFTQVSSQAVLLVGWWLVWQAVRAWAVPGKKLRLELAGLTLGAGIVNAAIFLLHFRVAGYYLPLLFITVVWELVQAYRGKQLKFTLLGITAVGFFSLLFILPAVIYAMQAYLAASAAAVAARGNAPPDTSYYETSLKALFSAGIQPWLFGVSVLAATLILVRRNPVGIMVLLWVVLLLAEGNTYRLGPSALNFTNLSAIFIMLFLPLSLLAGIGVEELFRLAPALNRRAVEEAGAALLLIAGAIAGITRTDDVEPYRYFVTPADAAAMEWINNNTPANAMFAINTHVWNKNAVHGTDGGYWIPYFTGRRTNTSSMIYTLGTAEYEKEVSAFSQTVKQLETDPTVLPEICDRGVDYIYIGANQFFPSRFQPRVIAELPGAQLVYDRLGVKIFRVCSP